MDTTKEFLAMLKAFLRQQPWNPPADLDLPECYRLSKIHNLEPVLYHMIKPHWAFFCQRFAQTMAKLEKAYRAAVYYALTQQAQAGEVVACFQKNAMDLALFKGYRIKDCYPVPELRTMGDLDLLIRRQDRESSHQLLLSLGYACAIGKGDVWVYRKGNTTLEVHTRIAENFPHNPFDYRAYFSDAISHTEEYQGYTCLENGYHLLFLIYHIAKHLNSTGAGIRLFLDIALFTNQLQGRLDWDVLWDTWREIGLDRAASAVFTLCNRWFGTHLQTLSTFPEETLQELESYIIAGGVFGFETHSAGDLYLRKGLVEKKSRSPFAFHMSLLKDYLFPSMEHMAAVFPPLKKHRYLLPVAYVKRWYLGIFRRRKNSVSMLKSMVKGDAQRAEKEQKMLDDLGLHKE